MSDHAREGDELLEEQANPAPEDVASEENPPARGPEGIEGEEHLGLTPPG